jgi:ferredoxin
MNQRTEAIREHAREMLASGQVECVIGYETGSDMVNARPFFAYAPADAERLVFDSTCTHNLAKYVVEPERRGKKLAIVAKPCDARSLNVLLEEKQIARERIVVIGVTCEGIVQRTREDGDATTPQDRCLICDQHTPVLYDVLVGPALPEGLSASPSSKVEQFEAQADSEREGFWAEQFDRCIRCYACRQACPKCYCSECFAETLDPEWVGIRIAPSPNWMFHTIRAFHLAGRCVGCDECERVCPVKIPLSLLNGKLRKDVADLFDFRAGLDPDQSPPLETFRKDEKLGVG